MTDNLSKEPDALLLKIIDNYTDALTRISLEQTNADDFDEHFKDIKRQTSEAIQQHYVSKAALTSLVTRARIDELNLFEAKSELDEYTQEYIDDRIVELKANLGKGQG